MNRREFQDCRECHTLSRHTRTDGCILAAQDAVDTTEDHTDPSPGILDGVTRIAVIWPDGHVNERIGVEVELQLQDDGRTLKVFVRRHPEADRVLAEYTNNLAGALADAHRAIERMVER